MPLRLLVRGAVVAAAAGLVLVTAPAAAQVHPSETSAVLVTVGEDEVDLDLQIPLDRYTLATDTDVAATDPDVAATDTDVAPTDAGVAAAAADIEAHVAGHLALTDGNGAYDVAVTSVELGTVDDLPTLLVDVDATPAGATVGGVVLDHDAVSERIATHDVCVSVVSDWRAAVAVVLPLVVLMSRSLAYTVVRAGLVAFGAVAAAAWGVAVPTGGGSVLQPAFDVVRAHPVAALVVLASCAHRAVGRVAAPSDGRRARREALRQVVRDRRARAATIRSPGASHREDGARSPEGRTGPYAPVTCRA
jgi:hypothetical protein